MNNKTPHTNFEDWHIKKLENPDEAKQYLQIALEDYEDDGDTATFLLAIRDVAKAQGGITKLSERTGLNRQSLYKSLSSKGNPRLNTFGNILQGLGYRLSIEQIKE